MVDAVAEYDYEGQEDDELTLRVGDTITDINKLEGGWWEGTLNGKQGVFPDNFVKEIVKEKEKPKEDPVAAKKPSSHVAKMAGRLDKEGGIKMGPAVPGKRDSIKRKKMKVTYSYNPSNDDELKLEVGDIIEVVKEEEESWWEGIVNGKQGMFPTNFVEELEDKEEVQEVQEIKGKKPKGQGFGNIFSQGPIQLKRTAHAKSTEEPEHKANGPDKSHSQEVKTGVRKSVAPPVPPVPRQPPALPPKETKHTEESVCRFELADKEGSLKAWNQIFFNMTGTSMLRYDPTASEQARRNTYSPTQARNRKRFHSPGRDYKSRDSEDICVYFPSSEKSQKSLESADISVNSAVDIPLETNALSLAKQTPPPRNVNRGRSRGPTEYLVETLVQNNHHNAYLDQSRKLLNPSSASPLTSKVDSQELDSDRDSKSCLKATSESYSVLPEHRKKTVSFTAKDTVIKPESTPNVTAQHLNYFMDLDKSGDNSSSLTESSFEDDKMMHMPFAEGNPDFYRMPKTDCLDWLLSELSPVDKPFPQTESSLSTRPSKVANYPSFLSPSSTVPARFSTTTDPYTTNFESPEGSPGAPEYSPLKNYIERNACRSKNPEIISYLLEGSGQEKLAPCLNMKELHNLKPSIHNQTKKSTRRSAPLSEPEDVHRLMTYYSGSCNLSRFRSEEDLTYFEHLKRKGRLSHRLSKISDRYKILEPRNHTTYAYPLHGPRGQHYYRRTSPHRKISSTLPPLNIENIDDTLSEQWSFTTPSDEWRRGAVSAHLPCKESLSARGERRSLPSIPPRSGFWKEIQKRYSLRKTKENPADVSGDGNKDVRRRSSIWKRLGLPVFPLGRKKSMDTKKQETKVTEKADLVDGTSAHPETDEHRTTAIFHAPHSETVSDEDNGLSLATKYLTPVSLYPTLSNPSEGKHSLIWELATSNLSETRPSSKYGSSAVKETPIVVITPPENEKVESPRNYDTSMDDSEWEDAMRNFSISPGSCSNSKAYQPEDSVQFDSLLQSFYEREDTTVPDTRCMTGNDLDTSNSVETFFDRRIDEDKSNHYLLVDAQMGKSSKGKEDVLNDDSNILLALVSSDTDDVGTAASATVGGAENKVMKKTDLFHVPSRTQHYAMTKSLPLRKMFFECVLGKGNTNSKYDWKMYNSNELSDPSCSISSGSQSDLVPLSDDVSDICTEGTESERVSRDSESYDSDGVCDSGSLDREERVIGNSNDWSGSDDGKTHEESTLEPDEIDVTPTDGRYYSSDSAEIQTETIPNKIAIERRHLNSNLDCRHYPRYDPFTEKEQPLHRTFGITEIAVNDETVSSGGDYTDPSHSAGTYVQGSLSDVIAHEPLFPEDVSIEFPDFENELCERRNSSTGNGDRDFACCTPELSHSVEDMKITSPYNPELYYSITSGELSPSGDSIKSSGYDPSIENLSQRSPCQTLAM